MTTPASTTDKPTASLTIHGIGKMNKKNRLKIASWLRRHADFIVKEGGQGGNITASRYRAGMRIYSMVLVTLCLLISGCLGVKVEVDKIGNEYAQHAYSRNILWPNYDRTTFCWELAKNGFCPKEDTRVETHTVTAQKAMGAAAAEAAVGSMPMALGLGLGLAHSGSRLTQSVGGLTTNEYFSTKCTAKCF